MRHSFLINLLQEPRDEIYGHVLRPPTGYVSFWASGERDGVQDLQIKIYGPVRGSYRCGERTLHLRRVCKQIYGESEDIFQHKVEFINPTHLTNTIHLHTILRRPRFN